MISWVRHLRELSAEMNLLLCCAGGNAMQYSSIFANLDTEVKQDSELNSQA